MKVIISWRTFAQRLNTSLSTAKRLESDDPGFPRKVQVSPGRVGFFEDEADSYIASRKRVAA
jgi:predicted DNA-binding transcriptional regulator AlpA